MHGSRGVIDEIEAFYTEVKHYLNLKTYHSLTTTAPNPESRKANIRRVSKTYLLKDEELYYRHKNKARLVACTNERARGVFRECHDKTKFLDFLKVAKVSAF
ncbi:unnamed protein product [Boreogadus saida]